MENGYDFYLKKCLLPVPPSKLTLKINNANKTVTLINEGEVNLLKQAGLTDVEFECLIPQVEYPFAVYKSGVKGADYFLGYFESLKTSKKPFQFIVCRKLPGGDGLFDTNMKVSLEDYQITEDAKNGFDLKVKIKLKQWRDYGTKTVRIRSETKAETESQRETDSSPAPAAAETYEVQEKDCLWKIAKKFYGDGSKYTIIYEANKGIVGGNPNLIYAGQVLTIPPI